MEMMCIGFHESSASALQLHYWSHLIAFVAFVRFCQKSYKSGGCFFESKLITTAIATAISARIRTAKITVAATIFVAGKARAEICFTAIGWSPSKI